MDTNTLAWIILTHLVATVCGLIHEVSKKDQNAALIQVATECYKQMDEYSTTKTNQPQNSISFASVEHPCTMDFDLIACWPPTAANQTAYLPCPDYLNLFDSAEQASRYCDVNGIWHFDTQKNKSMGDYRSCYQKSLKLQAKAQEMYDVDPSTFGEGKSALTKHLPYIQAIYATGNSISLSALVTAVVIFACFRKLLICCRNVLHVNLFISFILRATFTLIHYFVTSKQESEIMQVYEFDPDTNDYIIDIQRDWTCKLSTSIWMYTRLTNFMWIFIEALYLHLLIFTLTFNDKQYIYRLIVIGWGVPVIFLIPWIIVRVFVDDHKCWVTYSTPEKENLRWIVEAPVIFVVLINFGFFINIIKLLSTKLQMSRVQGFKQQTSRRLAKSTFILIPLFGVHYITFIFADLYPDALKNDTLELVTLYFNTIVTSFQGLAVAILFCFCNSEVIGEIKKKWNRLKDENQILSNYQAERHGSQTQRISLTSDMGLLDPSRRCSNGNGMTTLSLPTTHSISSLRRGSSNTVSIPSPIDEENIKLIQIDDNHNNTNPGEDTV